MCYVQAHTCYRIYIVVRKQFIGLSSFLSPYESGRSNLGHVSLAAKVFAKYGSLNEKFL